MDAPAWRRLVSLGEAGGRRYYAAPAGTPGTGYLVSVTSDRLGRCTCGGAEDEPCEHLTSALKADDYWRVRRQQMALPQRDFDALYGKWHPRMEAIRAEARTTGIYKGKLAVEWEMFYVALLDEWAVREERKTNVTNLTYTLFGDDVPRPYDDYVQRLFNANPFAAIGETEVQP